MDILEIPKEDWGDTGFQNLAIAVVQQACEDYKKAYMGEFVDHKSSQWVMDDIEQWVRSQDYEYLTKVNGPALLKKVRIAALEEMIEVYEDALSSGGDTKLRIFIQKPKKEPNVSFQIPPDYLQDFFAVMRKQLKILKNEKKPGPEIAFWITFILILAISMIWFVHTAKGEGLVSDEEIDMLAKTVWGEARGLNEYEQSLVIWCILNRFDSGKFGSSVKEIITKPYQFQGYKESFPIDEDILRLCKDVVYRWENSLEGRTLPEEYLYFYGDGKHNYYTTEYKGSTKYDFSLPNPYDGERGTYYAREDTGTANRRIKNQHWRYGRNDLHVLLNLDF